MYFHFFRLLYNINFRKCSIHMHIYQHFKLIHFIDSIFINYFVFLHLSYEISHCAHPLQLTQQRHT